MCQILGPQAAGCVENSNYAHDRNLMYLANIMSKFIIIFNSCLMKVIFDRVKDRSEEQEFWMTRIDWVGIQFKQFEMFEEHENCLSRWKQCCSSWKQCWTKTMYK